jgi:hypothetical protein
MSVRRPVYGESYEGARQFSREVTASRVAKPLSNRTTDTRLTTQGWDFQSLVNTINTITLNNARRYGVINKHIMALLGIISSPLCSSLVLEAKL